MGGSLCSKMIAVKKEGQAYTIEDLCGDVTYKPRVKNIEHVASLLGRSGEGRRKRRGGTLISNFIPVQR